MPLGFNDTHWPVAVRTKLVNAEPAGVEVRQVCLSGKRSRTALSEAVRSHTHATVAAESVELRSDEEDAVPMVTKLVEFHILLRFEFVRITELTLSGAHPTLKDLVLNGLKAIRFDDCQGEEDDLVGLIDANAGTLKELHRPTLGVLARVKPLELDLLTMDCPLEPEEEAQKEALLRHSIMEFSYVQLPSHSKFDFTQGFVLWLPAEKITFALNAIDSLRYSFHARRKEPLKHMAISMPYSFRDVWCPLCFTEIIRYHSLAFPNLEELSIECKHRYTQSTGWNMEFLIFTLKRVEWHLRDHPLPFKISFSANLEFICSGEYSPDNRDLQKVSENFERVHQSADLEETGRGHVVYQRRPDLGPRVDYLEELKFEFEGQASE